MREIKFRAWDKKNKELYQDGSIAINLNGKIQHKLGEILWDTNLIIMQYTGLKDKNGKEIYEGDILLIKNWEDRIDKFIKRTADVFFCEDYASYLIDGSRFGNKHWRPMLANVIGKGWSVEVIGNIYENPELLEVQDE